jgi:hypothetical protein
MQTGPAVNESSHVRRDQSDLALPRFVVKSYIDFILHLGPVALAGVF